MRIQEKVKNSELDSVTKCRIALKFKPTIAPALGEVPSATQSSPELSFLSSSSQEWHFVPPCSLTLQTDPDLQDTAGPASCLGLYSLLRAHVGQKLSKMGIQLLLNHGKNTKSPHKNTIHSQEVLTKHRAAPTPQSRSM